MKICLNFVLYILFCTIISNHYAYNWNREENVRQVQSRDTQHINDHEKLKSFFKKPHNYEQMHNDRLKIMRKTKPHSKMMLKNTYLDDQSNNNDENYDCNEKDNEAEKAKENKHEDNDNETIALSFDVDMTNFVGTNLFGRERKKCFSIEDVGLLTARRDFESLIPKSMPKQLPDDHLVSILMDYFYTCYEIIMRITTENSRNILQRAFYDTFGGYLNYYLLPMAKYSFYAGQLSLETVQNLVQLHKLCKTFLNVNGNGWRSPADDFFNEFQEMHIKPLEIKSKGDNNYATFCMNLYMSNDKNCNETDNEMIVSLPKLDSVDRNNFLGNIWLPFKCKRTYDLRADNSVNIVVKFYETVTRCYQYEHMDPCDFNEKFKNWYLENVQNHLLDEQFYPGFGSILRIYATLLQDDNKNNIDKDNDNDNDNNDDDDDCEKNNDDTDMTPNDDSEEDCKDAKLLSNNVITSEKNMHKRNFNRNTANNYLKMLDETKFLKTLENNDFNDQLKPFENNMEKSIQNNYPNNQNTIGIKRDSLSYSVNEPLSKTLSIVPQGMATLSNKTYEVILPTQQSVQKLNEVKNSNITHTLKENNLMTSQSNQTISNIRLLFVEMPPSVCVVSASILVLVIIITVYCCLRTKQTVDSKNKKSKPPVDAKKKKSKPANDAKKKNVKSSNKRKRGGADMKWKYGDEEEALLKSDSKSILTDTSPQSTKLVYKKEHFQYKTFKESDPPLIETTSLDYTSSEPDDTTLSFIKSEPKQKIVRIDEKDFHKKSLKSIDPVASKTKTQDKYQSNDRSSSWETLLSSLE